MTRFDTVRKDVAAPGQRAGAARTAASPGGCTRFPTFSHPKKILTAAGPGSVVSQSESVFVGVPALAGASAEDRLKAVLQRRQAETRPPVRDRGGEPK